MKISVLLALFSFGMIFQSARAQTSGALAPAPGPRMLEPADPKLPTLFLIGDSTVRNGRDDGQGRGAEGQWGWGNPIAAYFDLARINVVNRAVGGLSSRTFLTLGHWERTMALMKPGDFVIMQFGHNDDGALNDEPPGPLRARGTLKGTGDETKEIDNVMTKQHEIVHTYGWYLKKFIADAKAKGVTPIVASLVPRKIWQAGKIVRGPYVEWAAAAAKQGGAAFIDLNGLVAARYEALGPDKVTGLFADEHTHTNLPGAELNAECVIAGLKALQPNPLAAFLSGKAGSVSPAAR